MSRWDEETPAFKIIQALARLRRESPAIWKRAYRTIYADQDVMVFERRHATESVVVAVDRGGAATIDLPRPVHLDPGSIPAC